MTTVRADGSLIDKGSAAEPPDLARKGRIPLVRFRRHFLRVGAALASNVSTYPGAHLASKLQEARNIRDIPFATTDTKIDAFGYATFSEPYRANRKARAFFDDELVRKNCDAASGRD